MEKQVQCNVILPKCFTILRLSSFGLTGGSFGMLFKTNQFINYVSIINILKTQFRNLYKQITHSMGNIVDRIEISKSEVLTTATLFSVIGYLIYEAREKTRIREILLSKKNNTGNMSQQAIDFMSQMNQVYLKQEVDYLSIRNEAEFPIYKIVVTGGPCAGKTSSLDRIRQQMSERGYRVFSVPEVPTMVVVAGGMILMSKFDTQQRIKFQSLLMRFQMYAEDYFTRLAKMSKSPSIVLCDRGVVDPYAYISKEQFQAIMDQQGWSWVTLRDRRYDRAIFLSSAAEGAEDFYTLDNNVARSEGIQTARALNGKTLQAWTGHPHLTVIANKPGETFQDKIEHAVKAVQKTVGLEQVNVSYEKYLINPPNFPANLKVEAAEIEQGFLLNDDPRYDEDKIKRRGQNNSYTYQRKYRTKKNHNGDYVQQIRKPLTSLQYVTLKEQSLDPNYNVISRERVQFVYNNISYAIDVYGKVNGEDNVHLLRFNSQNGNPKELIPEFIELIKDVKRDKSYSLRQISRKQ